MDKNKLLYFIKDRGFTVKAFCEAIGTSYSSFYKKLNSKYSFSLKDVYTIAEFLKLTPEDIVSIFFSDYVSKTET